VSLTISLDEKVGTYNDDLHSDKQDNDQFHPRGGRLWKGEVPVVGVPLWLDTHLSQQLTQHRLQLSGISDLLVDRMCSSLDLQSLADGVEVS
jgi:hypothetical protein